MPREVLADGCQATMVRPRIAFCNTLRGLAALTVLLAHYTHGFNALGGWLYNPIGGGAYPDWFLNICRVDGAFGVAIFFLVSGFVIPMSFNNRSAAAFLVARAIRLYPTFIACTAITLTLAIGFGIDPANKSTLVRAVYSMTFFRDWLGALPFDSIVWTLEIEAKFYLYAALMLPLLKTRPLVVALVPTVATICFLIFDISPTYPIAGILQGNGISTLFWNIGYLSFICVGTLFYLHYAGAIILRTFLVSLMFALTAASGFLLVRYPNNDAVLPIYIGATLTFAVFYVFFRDRKWMVTEYLSKISYPLYAVHASVGYVLLSFFIYRVGMAALIALPLVILLVMLIAYAIHLAIEAPSMRLSSGRAARSFGKA